MLYLYTSQPVKVSMIDIASINAFAIVYCNDLHAMLIFLQLQEKKILHYYIAYDYSYESLWNADLNDGHCVEIR